MKISHRDTGSKLDVVTRYNQPPGTDRQSVIRSSSLRTNCHVNSGVVSGKSMATLPGRQLPPAPRRHNPISNYKVSIHWPINQKGVKMAAAGGVVMSWIVRGSW